ncbi:MAG: SUMF1/EgtB/PvdO family nonheme iron enzyme [Verrucomicrobiota bacterium]|nr:SUMF1/EgtB/PvdO family nonheme iron enzyme [Verrucomicrobiota bacterium]
MIEVWGDYILQRELGSGVFGPCYLAEHRFLKRPFVLKKLSDEFCSDPSFGRRFEAEIAAIANLNHPNLLPIYSASFHEGFYFLVADPLLEEKEAFHLDHFLQKGKRKLSEEEIFFLLGQLASVLDYAHEQGIFHGALKPTNLFILPQEQRVLLSDFGLVRMVGEKHYLLSLCRKAAESVGQTALESHRHFLQGFSCLAPEQKALDFQLIDARADSYAFGILAYYFLTSKWPEGHFDLPSKLLPGLSYHWDLLISRCLQSNPLLRPQKLQQALEEYLHAPRSLSPELVPSSELGPIIDHAQQMAFSFPVAEEQSASQKPLLQESKIERPEFEPDPGAIFHRDSGVSHYTPKQSTYLEVEPLLTEMVVIPGGTWWRGSSGGARDEMPRHQVHLPSFAIDIHPITNEQFLRFLQAMGGEKDHNNCDMIRLRDARIKRSGGKVTIESGYARHPVVGVTWYGAIAYAKWVGKRLPTEAEWEAAAMGGQSGILYPTGENIERTHANFFSSDTTAVQSYPPNGFGLYDMAGNVYEWCSDWYAYNAYEHSLIEPQAPKGPNQGVYRILRGGCWKSLKEDMRCSHRHRNNPGAVNGTYGFRCAADVS